MAKQGQSLYQVKHQLQVANRCLSIGDRAGWDNALQALFMSAPKDESIALLVADVYQAENEKEKAIGILQNHLSCASATPAIMAMVACLAMSLELYDMALKVLVQLTAMEPRSPAHYVNIAECMKKQEQYIEALDFIAQVLPQFPETVSVWASFVSLLEVNSAQKGFASSPLCKQCLTVAAHYIEDGITSDKLRDAIASIYAHALRLDPKHFNILNNFANFLGPSAKSVDLYLSAIEIQPNHPQPNIGLAIRYLSEGRLEEAWPHYEYRRVGGQGLAKGFELDIELPEWDGSLDKKKSLLVFGEQGLGDEIFFLMNLKKLSQEFRKIYVACDPRLVKILQRSFPDCEFTAYIDAIKFGKRVRHCPGFDDLLKQGKIDFQILSGSLPKFLWPTPIQIPNVTGGYICALPPQERWGLEKLDQNKPKIGISWRSGNLSEGRKAGYWGIESVEFLLETIDAHFVNLQYGATNEEVAHLARYRNFVHLPDVDLKNDLEANLSIMAQCDLVIGPPIATQMLSFALGRPTWLPVLGLPWYAFGKKADDGLFYARHMRLIDARVGRDFSGGYWQTLVQQICDTLLDTPSSKGTLLRDQVAREVRLSKNSLLAIFTMGLTNNQVLVRRLKWLFRKSDDELVFLNDSKELAAKENNIPYWPQMALEKRLSAKVLYGGQVTLQNLQDLMPHKSVTLATFLTPIQTSVLTQYAHHLEHTPSNPLARDLFIVEHRRDISQSYRLLKDFAGFSPEDAGQVFEVSRHDDLFAYLKVLIEKFHFIGLCNAYYNDDVRQLSSRFGLGEFQTKALAFCYQVSESDGHSGLDTSLLRSIFALDLRIFEHVLKLREIAKGPFISTPASIMDKNK